MIRVLQALNSWQRRDFDYGDADCCQFAAFIVKELTGKDYISSFIYNSEQDATDIIASHGDLASTVSTVLGSPVHDYWHLNDGSPVLVNYNGMDLLAVKLGEDAVCLTKKGLASISNKYIVLGWPICLK